LKGGDISKLEKFRLGVVMVFLRARDGSALRERSWGVFVMAFA